MQVEAVEGGHRVVPPSWRFDLSQEADLIEEVARIVGYNEIPDIDAPMPQRPRPVPEGVIAVQRFALALVDRGYVEAINYTFVDPGWQAKVHPGAATLALKNPISAELAEMRVSLWPGLLKGLRDNLNRQQTRVRMFEHGAKFVVQANELKEINCISGLAYGTVSAEQWATPSTPLDFYDVKSDVESLLALSRAGAIDRFVVAHLPCLHPGRCARIERDGRALGWIGELHPELAREFGFSRAPVLFELELAVLSQASLPRARELSRYPAVRRDLAVVVDESISFDALVESVTVGSDAALSDVRVFDVYRGKGVETGRKSVALGLIFQDKNKTLTDADVETALSGIRQRLQRDLNAVFRD